MVTVPADHSAKGVTSLDTEVLQTIKLIGPFGELAVFKARS